MNFSLTCGNVTSCGIANPDSFHSGGSMGPWVHGSRGSEIDLNPDGVVRLIAAATWGPLSPGPRTICPYARVLLGRRSPAHAVAPPPAAICGLGGAARLRRPPCPVPMPTPLTAFAWPAVNSLCMPFTAAPAESATFPTSSPIGRSAVSVAATGSSHTPASTCAAAGCVTGVRVRSPAAQVAVHAVSNFVELPVDGTVVMRRPAGTCDGHPVWRSFL